MKTIFEYPQQLNKQDEKESFGHKFNISDNKYNIRETQNNDLLFHILKIKELEKKKKDSKFVDTEKEIEVFAYPEDLINK